MKKTLLFVLAMCIAVGAGAVETFVSFTPTGGGFAVVKGGKPVNVVCTPDDHEGVRMAAANLAKDFGRVSGTDAALVQEPQGECVIVGSLKSVVIQQARKGRQGGRRAGLKARRRSIYCK